MPVIQGYRISHYLASGVHLDTTGQYGLMCCIFTIVIHVNKLNALKREPVLAAVYQCIQAYV